MNHAKAWNRLKSLYEWKVEIVKNVEDRSSWDEMVTECDKHVLVEMERIEESKDVKSPLTIYMIKVAISKWENEEMNTDELITKLTNIVDGIY